MLTNAELKDAMRPIVCMYGPVVRQRNMIAALKQCGMAPPADPGGGVSYYNDVLVQAISDELRRRETYFEEV
jgi:hypothetical protein